MLRKVEPSMYKCVCVAWINILLTKEACKNMFLNRAPLLGVAAKKEFMASNKSPIWELVNLGNTIALEEEGQTLAGQRPIVDVLGLNVM